MYVCILHTPTNNPRMNQSTVVRVQKLKPNLPKLILPANMALPPASMSSPSSSLSRRQQPRIEYDLEEDDDNVVGGDDFDPEIDPDNIVVPGSRAVTPSSELPSPSPSPAFNQSANSYNALMWVCMCCFCKKLKKSKAKTWNAS